RAKRNQAVEGHTGFIELGRGTDDRQPDVWAAGPDALERSQHHRTVLALPVHADVEKVRRLPVAVGDEAGEAVAADPHDDDLILWHAELGDQRVLGPGSGHAAHRRALVAPAAVGDQPPDLRRWNAGKPPRR